MTISKRMMNSFSEETRCPTTEATQKFGEQLGGVLHRGSVIALSGDLGAGKTELVKGIAKGLNYPGNVTSPTFTLIHEYRGGRLPIYHMDLYRLELETEIDELGFDDYLFGEGVCVIEWAEKFPDRIPANAIPLRIVLLENGDRLIFS